MKNDKKNGGLWQFVKFAIFGTIGGIIQVISVNVLYFAMKGWTTPLPAFLGGIFSEKVLGEGNSCWGYIVPFFLSNLISQIFQYVQNKKTTFKSDAPKWVFGVYIAVAVLLMFIITWTQGVLNNFLSSSSSRLLTVLAPTLAVVIAGQIYTVVMFPLEKFVLFRKARG